MDEITTEVNVNIKKCGDSIASHMRLVSPVVNVLLRKSIRSWNVLAVDPLYYFKKINQSKNSDANFPTFDLAIGYSMAPTFNTVTKIVMIEAKSGSARNVENIYNNIQNTYGKYRSELILELRKIGSPDLEISDSVEVEFVFLIHHFYLKSYQQKVENSCPFMKLWSYIPDQFNIRWKIECYHYINNAWSVCTNPFNQNENFTNLSMCYSHSTDITITLGEIAQRQRGTSLSLDQIKEYFQNEVSGSLITPEALDDWVNSIVTKGEEIGIIEKRNTMFYFKKVNFELKLQDYFLNKQIMKEGEDLLPAIISDLEAQGLISKAQKSLDLYLNTISDD
jgi:hypothetical protein